MSSKNLVSVVIPCFNEEKVISETIKRLLEIGNEIKAKFQLRI